MADAAEGPLRVECFSGYRADERPEAFWLCQRRIAVREVLDCWLGADHRYFKVTGDDGKRYILRQDDYHDRWDLARMEAPAAPTMEAQR